MFCPGPLVGARKAITDVKVGEILEIRTGDTNTWVDMLRWREKFGHDFLGVLPGDG